MPDALSATLPINLERGIYLDPQRARAFGDELCREYCFAEPYPHIVLDDFLPAALAQRILDNFPREALAGDVHHESAYGGLHKRQISPNECNDYARNVFAFFNSAPFLQFLEGLTRIEGLISDPYFNGGGFHEIRRGGKLGIHADFRINEQLCVNRRLNVLIYLNPGWDRSYGGELEIWDKEMKGQVRSIAPLFNRCVIFNTEADSYHGHPDALNTPEAVTRKSIALYYYTASRAVYDETASHGTMYKARPQDGADIRRQVIKYNATNFLRDWVIPPLLWRQLRLAARKLRRAE